MRKMMEGIVLYGTGRTAALNGYSAGGKTGTAQKIDIATHKYSKTNVVASFAGFAPINNPAISVAVIIDSPQGEHHGAWVSAPVFAEVAQEVLEYLGVPHDEPMKPQREVDAEHSAQGAGDDGHDDDSDLQAMFAEVNNLPADDPLRAPQNAQLPAPAAADGSDHGVSMTPTSLAEVTGESVPGYKAFSLANLVAPRSAAPKENISPQKDAASAVGAAAASRNNGKPFLDVADLSSKPSQNDVPIVTDAKRRVSVPSFVGEPLRKVVESAGVAGLGVQLLGDGIARDQAPAAGTLVPIGTEVVVRFRH
jgi:cell division protein FtsI (penicillin-binding protein 3)